MKIVESFLTKNPCYKSNREIDVKGLMLHSVGCPQPSAKVFVNNWNREKCDDKCVHALIDANDGTVYQTLPWMHRGRHCGRHSVTKNTANDTHIGIAMCEPAQIKYKKSANFEVVGNKDLAVACVRRTYESAVELFSDLCQKFNLNPMTDILSHTEGHKQGIASAKESPEYLWEQLGLEYTMDGFRADVAKRLGVATVAPIADEPEIAAQSEVEEVAAEPTVEEPKEWKIRISVENLRIRSGPGTSYEPIGKYTGMGIFCITEIQNGSGSEKGWGKLRNGSGWVCLDYVEMLSR